MNKFQGYNYILMFTFISWQKTENKDTYQTELVMSEW